MLSLGECLRVAMEMNHTRPASQFAVAIAEAQHRQALAAYWPQVNARGGVDEMSSSPNFLYPASTMYIPAQSITLPGGSATVTIPANSFGPGFPPVAVQMPFLSGTDDQYQFTGVSNSDTKRQADEPDN